MSPCTCKPKSCLVLGLVIEMLTDGDLIEQWSTQIKIHFVTPSFSMAWSKIQRRRNNPCLTCCTDTILTWEFEIDSDIFSTWFKPIHHVNRGSFIDTRSSRRKLKKNVSGQTILFKRLKHPTNKRVLVGYRLLNFCYLVLGHSKDAVDIHGFRMVSCLTIKSCSQTKLSKIY